LDTASVVLLSLFGLFLLMKFFGFLSRLGIKQVTPRQMDQMKGMAILDVRTDKEFKDGHIPGSLHIPLDELGTRAKKLRRDKELVVYCQSGNRSIWAIKRLMGMGFTNLHNLRGGYHAWKRTHR
jgi:rhodanese-related sulfurtransferase